MRGSTTWAECISYSGGRFRKLNATAFRSSTWDAPIGITLGLLLLKIDGVACDPYSRIGDIPRPLMGISAHGGRSGWRKTRWPTCQMAFCLLLASFFTNMLAE